MKPSVIFPIIIGVCMGLLLFMPAPHSSIASSSVSGTTGGGTPAPKSGLMVSIVARKEPPVVPSNDYRYDALPSISEATYINIYCSSGSEACGDAKEMYAILVTAGIDPVVQAAQAQHETNLGKAGVGNPNIKNMHGVQCHAGDNRIGDSPVPWGNGCAGIYASYAASVETWARLINREYVAVGLNTPDKAVWKYAPVGKDGNNPPAYIADMHRWIDTWRREG